MKRKLYGDGTARIEGRRAPNPTARKMRARQDSAGFLRDLAAMVVVLGLLLAIALWAGAPWVAMSLWEMPELPGIICIVLLGGVVLLHLLGKEDPSSEAVGTPPEGNPGG
jgi:fatty acid desaturase